MSLQTLKEKIYAKTKTIPYRSIQSYPVVHLQNTFIDLYSCVCEITKDEKVLEILELEVEKMFMRTAHNVLALPYDEDQEYGTEKTKVESAPSSTNGVSAKKERGPRKKNVKKAAV